MHEDNYYSLIFKCNGTESLNGDCANVKEYTFTSHLYDTYVICSNWNNLQKIYKNLFNLEKFNT